MEFFREAATVIMLGGIGILTGRSKTEKFAIFIFCFAVWDIFYYVFLKIFLNWPESFFTWDILFLIPVPWIGPVLAPVIVSITIILLASLVIYFEEKKCETKFSVKEKIYLLSGCCFCIFSFVEAYVQYVLGAGEGTGFWNINSEKALFKEMANYVPDDFNWMLFSVGEIILLFGMAMYFFRMKKPR